MIPEHHEIDPRDIESLAQVLRQVDGNHELGAAALAERILEEWGLIYNYERLVRACLQLGADLIVQTLVDVDVDLFPKAREFRAAIAPFEETRDDHR